MSSPAATPQPSYRNCFVCGRENPIGLKVRFYQRENQVVTHFIPGPEHQGYPGRMHGGIAATLLDETIGRAGYIYGFWTYTIEFKVKYRKPIPLGEEITVVGEMTKDRGRAIEAQGQLLLADGSVAMEASGLFFKLRPEELEKIEEEVQASGQPDAITIRGLTVDFSRKEVRVDGEAVAATPGEYRLLACLAARPGRVISSAELLKEMSGYGCGEQEAQEIVKVHVSRLRAKIDRDPTKPSYILNVRGFGYMLERRNEDRFPRPVLE